MKKLTLPALALVALAPCLHAQTTTIADWTFETTAPATSGPFSPEVGAGAALGFHAGTTTYSAPAGDGSTHSFSSNGWATNDYYQFTVSTLNLDDIQISFDQTGSSTGPKDFKLEYSTDGGTSFTNLESYSLLVNGSPNTPWSSTGSENLAYNVSGDLTGIAGVDNNAALIFRMVDADSTALNGGTVASAGTDRVDNVIITGEVAAAPEPASYGFGLLAVIGFAVMRFRRQSLVR